METAPFDPEQGLFHAEWCKKHGSTTNNRSVVEVEPALGVQQAAAFGDRIALLTSTADNKRFELRVAAPERSALTAPTREVIARGPGGAAEVAMVSGRAHLLLLVRPTDSDGWAAYELDARGAARKLTP